jgi:hypothetical protein
MAIQTVLGVEASFLGYTPSTRVRLDISPCPQTYLMHDFMTAIKISNFVEMIRFFTTLILNVDESEMP